MTTISLIPRVRVNYSFKDLWYALWISERYDTYRSILKKQLEEIYHTSNILLTSSGRSSLYMILKSLPQQKVHIPAYTCIAVVEAILLASKEIVYVKTESETFNANEYKDLDANSIVVATHQYGIPCDIKSISEACQKSGAVLIEDCAGAMGTEIEGQQVGTFGDYGFFSFDSSKLINVPSKGGFIISRSSETLQAIIKATNLKSSDLHFKVKHLCRGLVYSLLKSGISYKCFHYLTMGRKHNVQLENHSTPSLELSDFYQYTFSEWQASIAVKQVQRIKDIITKRKSIYEYYDRNLHNNLILKPIACNSASCIRYSVRVENRDNFYWYLIRNGIDGGFSFRNIAAPNEYVDEHHIANTVLNIPFYASLKKKEIEKVVKIINEYE